MCSVMPFSCLLGSFEIYRDKMLKEKFLISRAKCGLISRTKCWIVADSGR